VIFCYYQYYYLRNLPVFLHETWALALVVLRWRYWRMVVLCAVNYSACLNNVEVVACKNRF